MLLLFGLAWLPLLAPRKRLELAGCDSASTEGDLVGRNRLSGTLVGWSSSSNLGAGEGGALGDSPLLLAGATVVMMGTKKERSPELAGSGLPLGCSKGSLLVSAAGSGGGGGDDDEGWPDLLSGRKVARSGCQTSGELAFAADSPGLSSRAASALRRPLSKLDWHAAGRKWGSAVRGKAG